MDVALLNALWFVLHMKSISLLASGVDDER